MVRSKTSEDANRKPLNPEDVWRRVIFLFHRKVWSGSELQSGSTFDRDINLKPITNKVPFTIPIVQSGHDYDFRKEAPPVMMMMMNLTLMGKTI